ncbi:MAG TPA: hypothetical protein VJ376_03425, partial [Pseudomonadota bacterium]|nr:hypothetical protein [Pseudomonadota bacterium]
VMADAVEATRQHVDEKRRGTRAQAASWSCMRRLRHELGATVDEQRTRTDNECIDPLLHKGGKGRVDVAIGGCQENFDLPP